AKRRDPLDRLGEVARRIRLAATALRRKEWRIRLHQHVVKRDDTGRPDDAVGGGIGHGGGERDVEAAGQRLRREGGVAAEAMKDAALAREFVEDREQVWKRVSGMQHHRPLELLCQTE